MFRNKTFFYISGGLVLINAILAILYFGKNQQTLAQKISLTPQIYSIVLGPNGFEPSTITIGRGSSVRFTTTRKEPFWPASNLHPSHLIYSEFDPKKEIPETQSWLFQFDKVGSWRYHDHLAPNYTGLINVVSSSVTAPAVDLDCSKQSDLSGKQKCWDDLLQTTVDTKGLDAAFKLFVDLYNTDPTIPKACHGWAHILGKAAFDLYKNHKDFILRPETSYCGYGFFHGFMEQLLHYTGNIKETRDFCDYASKQLGSEARGTFINCIHGIGHGAVNIDDPRLWGHFQAMIDPALKICPTVVIEPHELETCYEGAFNAMSLIANNGEYNLSLNQEDPFWLCRTQEEKYKTACYYEFSGVLSNTTKHNFIKAIGLLQKEKLPDDMSRIVTRKIAADFMQDDIAQPDQTKNVLDCRKIVSFLHDACLQGVSLGFISHGQPEKEYVKGLAFCKNPVLNPGELDICYQEMLGQLISKDSPICSEVEEKYRKYCY